MSEKRSEKINVDEDLFPTSDEDDDLFNQAAENTIEKKPELRQINLLDMLDASYSKGVGSPSKKPRFRDNNGDVK